MTNTAHVEIQLTITPLPPAAEGQLQLGVQRGTSVVATQDVSAERPSLMVTLEVTAVPQPDHTYDWKGLYVHGRPGDRFLYLNWGRQEDDGWHGDRRAKIPLRLIPTELVETAVAQNGILQGTLSGVARDGGPAAASIKTVQWQLKT